MRVSEIESIRPHVWIQADGLLEVWNGAGGVAISRQQLAEVVQRVTVVRVELDRFLVVFERRRVIPRRVGGRPAGSRIEKSRIRTRGR
jgi:hypothetical protein